MILIATDEAGYGPKLGPLVVAASAWRIPSEDAPADALLKNFESLRTPCRFGGTTVVVDDSKAVFRPKSAGKSGGGRHLLESVALAGCSWCGQRSSSGTRGIVEEIAPDDIQAIAKTPWLSEMFTPNDCSTDYSDLIQHWSASGAILLGLRARLVTANEFNQHCGGGLNKSDLLSSVTLALVRTMLERTHAAAENEPVTVFCDRHGGRRYYASALQSQFDGSLIRVVEETQRESRYRVPFGEHDFQIRFTVKGDSFPPVAFSSVVAKYMRELAMESLNSYFQKHHTGAAPLRPTAGYPQDADRFLADVSETVKRLAIPSSRLIRCR